MSEPNKGGRPPVYHRDVADEICARIAKGESLRSICRGEEMPARSTVQEWVVQDVDGFAGRYARARELGLQEMADELMEVADDGSNDWMLREGKDGEQAWVLNGEHVQRSRLRVDTRKWVLSKLAPKVYGDRLAHTGPDGGAMVVRLAWADDEIPPEG